MLDSPRVHDLYRRSLAAREHDGSQSQSPTLNMYLFFWNFLCILNIFQERVIYVPVIIEGAQEYVKLHIQCVKIYEISEILYIFLTTFNIFLTE